MFVLQSGNMKKILFVFFLVSLLLISAGELAAQCSICTKTAQQLGEGPAKGMNSGILYLAFAPFAIIGYVGYRWYKGQQSN